MANAQSTSSIDDTVKTASFASGARVAVMPCCHDLDVAETGDLTGWLDGPTAVDVVRVSHLRARGWRVWTQTIPATITPHNRLLMAAPPDWDPPQRPDGKASAIPA